MARARIGRRRNDAALREVGEPRLHDAGRAAVNRVLVGEPREMRQARQDFAAGFEHPYVIVVMQAERHQQRVRGRAVDGLFKRRRQSG